MSDQEKKGLGIKKGLTNYGDKEFSAYLRRSFSSSQGYTRKSLDKPVVGICTTPSDFNNCHRHFPELLEAVKRGVIAAGGIPRAFPVMSLGEVFMSPTSMKYRNLMAMAVEEMVRSQPMDSVVLIGGCDKTLPALMMGAASADVPAVALVAGPMMTGRYKGERLGACTDCRRFWGKYRAEEISKDEIQAIESNLSVTAGTCAVMGTASTMACILEALGMILPHSAAIPAVHADRLRCAEETGELAMQLIDNPIRPSEIITRDSVENALRILLAISGSTNAIIHLTAIAGRCGIDIPLSWMNELSDETPVLVNLKPVGDNYMEDFYAAGGLEGVLRELAPMLNLECRTVTGETLGERLEKNSQRYIDRNIIASAENPIDPKGGLISLSGSLAPEGAILKRAAATPELMEHEGIAVVFENPEDLAARIDDPDLPVTKDSVLVLKQVGPKSASGMPEAGYLPIPKKLAKEGVKDLVRISDARMSGTAFGTIVLHVTPESAADGPLSLVKNGDRIRLSASNNSIDLLVDEAVLEMRREEQSQVFARSSTLERGYSWLYNKHVLSANQGCDFDFLRPSQKLK